ncbi:MAG: hypothetical protein C0423_14060 [Methylibium sp.]|nr:hypothetical protein [Methylibium sp.]
MPMRGNDLSAGHATVTGLHALPKTGLSATLHMLDMRGALQGLRRKACEMSWQERPLALSM